MRHTVTAVSMAFIMVGLPWMLTSMPVRADGPTPFVAVPDSAFRAVPEPHAAPDGLSAAGAFSSPTPIPAIYESIQVAPPPPPRPHVDQPQPKVIVVTVPRPTPVTKSFARSGRSLRGNASWYCWPSYPSACANGFPYGGNYGAAGPALRAALCGSQACTSWRGRTVYVNGVPVRLIDWCQCFWHQSNEKLIDLYHNVWEATGAQNGVTITW